MPSTSLGYFYDYHRRAKRLTTKSKGAQEPRPALPCPSFFSLSGFGSGLGLKPEKNRKTRLAEAAAAAPSSNGFGQKQTQPK